MTSLIRWTWTISISVNLRQPGSKEIPFAVAEENEAHGRAQHKTVNGICQVQ